MIKRYFLLLIVFISVSSLFAQNEICNISGKVTDIKHNPVSYASVAIYDGNNPVAGAVTQESGNFTIKAKQDSKQLKLVVEFIGYNKYDTLIVLNKSQLKVPDIILKESAIALGEVVVTAKESSQKSTVEHTTINASANMVSNKGTALDILKGASSVSISNNEIYIRGNSNILVLLDGMPTSVTDLSSIAAANIKNIDVITNPDASFDAQGTGGIINIVSKKSRGEGYSGIVSFNYGFNHFITANTAFSYKSAKTLWRFNYNIKYEDDKINSTLNRKINSSGYELFQTMESNRYTLNNNIGLGADFNLNKSNKVSVDIKAIIPHLNIEQNLSNSFKDNGIANTENRYNNVSWNRENIDGSITYNHIIKPNISDITIGANVSKIWGERPSYYYKEGKQTNKSVSGGSPFISSVIADYKNKFKVGTLSAGIKFTYRRNSIYHNFYDYSNGDWIYSNSMSNDLVHSEIVPAIYAMFASKISKNITYKVGIRGEFSTVTLDSEHEDINKRNNTFFISPSLLLSYKPKQNKELSLALSRRIGRPTYPQLNPYMSMVDATTYEQGNMNLKSEESTKIDLSYSIKGKKATLFIDGYLNYTTDYISQITIMDNQKLITTYVNADSDIKSGADISLKVNLIKWLNFSIGTNTYYTCAKGVNNNSDISNSGWTNNSNMMVNLVPWKGGEIQMQYFVTTPEYYPQLTSALTHQMNIGIKHRILKGALTFSLLATDVFKTAKWEVWSNNTLFNLSNSSYNKSRMVWLGISYNFNAFKQKGNNKSESNRSLIRLGM